MYVLRRSVGTFLHVSQIIYSLSPNLISFVQLADSMIRCKTMPLAHVRHMPQQEAVKESVIKHN
jgi:hypothetical protein